MRINSKDIESIVAIKDKIDEDFEKKYFLDQLAREAGMGVTKFKYLFHELYDMGVFQYLHDRRMNAAKDILANSDQPIKRIAAMAGFDYVSNFTNAFKKKYGMTPSQFRNKS